MPIKFDPFPYGSEENLKKIVRDILRFDEYDLLSARYSGLPALYQLAADPTYKNIPISPASILCFGGCRGEVAAVIAVGASHNYVVTVCDPDRFNAEDYAEAQGLYRRFDCADAILSVIGSSDLFEYHCTGRARMTYFEGFRENDEDLAVELSMEINVAAERQDSVMRDAQNWFCFSGYGIIPAVTGMVDKMLTDWVGLFQDCYLTGNLVCAGYIGGFDWKEHNL